MRQHACVLAVIVLGLSAPARADVTIKQTTEGKGLGMTGKTAGVGYFKGNKMRTDAVLGDKTQTIIFDLDNQKMFVFDSKKKEAEVWDMAAFAQELSKSVDASSIKASIKPNGQTKQIASHTAAGYDMEISMDSGIGGSKEMMMSVTLVGPTWIVKNAPGAADYARFYKAAAEKGWIFTDPRAAKGQPGQAKAMAEMYHQIAAIGGIPYQTDMQIKIGGSGPMALIGRMGNLTMSTTVESVETTPLADDMFAPPVGYKLNPKK